MNSHKCFIMLALVCLLLTGCSGMPVETPPAPPATPQACTSFCLDNGDHCVFGTNQDNSVDRGLLVIKGRHVLKTGWEPGTSGHYARWTSKYGSVTFDYAAYQMAWAGMNEAGLMISTMALNETRNPAPDERPPLVSALWVQYQLDNHSTVAEVLASDAQVRIADLVDHYLVCDRQGDCAVIEFLEGKMITHTGESLPAKALANSVYQESVSAWQDRTPWGVKVHWLEPDGPVTRAGIKVGDVITAVDGVELDVKQSPTEVLDALFAKYGVGDEVQFTIRRQGEQDTITVAVELGARTTEEGQEVPTLGGFGISSATSLPRFVTAADRLEAFEPAGSEDAVAYAFDTLEAVAQAATAWSIVFDPANLRVYFRTNKNPQLRYVDLSKIDFSCRAPVTMLDIHAALSGDISADFEEYSHRASLDHTLNWMVERGQQDDYPPLLVEVLLRGAESFSCKEGAVSVEEKAGTLIEGYSPLLPPPLAWAGMAIFYRFWPIWLLLTLLSLTVVIWHLGRRRSTSWSQRLVWAVGVAVLGPLGLLVYLLVYRKRRLAPRDALVAG